MFLPIELSRSLCEHVPLESWSQMARSNSLFGEMLLYDATLAERQCQIHGYPGRTLKDLKRGHQTMRNWNLLCFSRNQIPTQGNICFLLDGGRSRAFGSTLPYPASSRFWDLQGGHELLKVEEPVCAAVLRGEILLSGDRMGILSIRDLRQGSVLTRSVAHGSEVSVLDADQDANLIITGSAEGSVKVWDRRQLSSERSTWLETLPISAVAMSTNGQKLAWGTVAGQLTVHQGDGPSKIFCPNGGAINCMKFANGLLIAGLEDGDIRIIAPEEQTKRITTESNSPVVSIQRINDRIVAGHANGLISINGEKRDSAWIAERRGIVWQLYVDHQQILSSCLERKLLVHNFSPTFRRSDPI